MNRSKIKLVYILGNSRSGSTILSIYLGLHPHITYLGEFKKLNDSYHERYCSCGQKAESCSFWRPIIKQNMAVFSRKEPSDAGWYRLISTCLAIFKKNDPRVMEEDEKLIIDVSQSLNSTSQGDQFILDSSKSLKRYICLSELNEVELYTILIERDIRSNLASYVKRGMGLISSYLRIVVNLKMTTRYLSRNNIPYFRVKYEAFASNPEKTRAEILKYLGLHDDVKYDQTIENFHLLSGSPNTIKAFKKSQTIKVQREQKGIFSKNQLRILKLLGL